MHFTLAGVGTVRQHRTHQESRASGACTTFLVVVLLNADWELACNKLWRERFAARSERFKAIPQSAATTRA